MDRRSFVKLGAGTLVSAPFILGGKHALFANNSASPITTVFDAKASMLDFTAGTTPNADGVIEDIVRNFGINRTRVSSMMDTAVMKMTGKTSVGKAWEALFPAGQPTQNTKIAIKLNFSYGERFGSNDWSDVHCPFGPKVALSDAIIHGLTQMLDGNFPIENITIFDKIYSSRTRWLFPVTQGYRAIQANGVGIYKDTTPGTYGMHWISYRNPFELPANAPSFLAAPDYPADYRAPQRIIPSVYQNDFMINVSTAKDHRAAGVTGVMKNTYGCTDNPFGTHGNEWMNDDTPYAGTKRCVPVFYKNIDQHAPTILNVLDALAGLYHGGPLEGKVFQANTIAVSKDPVALDYYLMELINKHRLKNGLSALSVEEGKAKDGHKNATFLRYAQDVHHMGTISLQNTALTDLSNELAEYELPVLDKSQSRVSEVGRSNNKLELHIHLDDSRRQHVIESHIEDLEGNTVKSLKEITTKSSDKSLDWDLRNDQRQEVSDKFYVWKIKVDGVLHARTIRTK